MAKQDAAPAPTSAETAARASGDAHQASNAQPTQVTQQAPRGPQADTVEVVEWGNGEAKSIFDKPAEGEKPAASKAEPEVIEHESAKAKPAEETEAEPEEAAPDPEVTKAAASAAERRKAIFASLEAEKTKRSIETQAQAQQKRADDAEARFEALKKAPLAERLAALGIDRQELEDKLLIGADDLKALPAKKEPPPPTEDPEIKELKAWRAQQLQREQAEGIAKAHAAVADHLKDADLPVVDSLNGYGRVLAKAHDAWVAGGKAGHVRDYLGDAGEIVEAEMRAENPKLAARLARGAAKKENAEVVDLDAPPAAATRAAPPPRASMGKRTAAVPGTKPRELPIDPLERDAAIKAEFAAKHPNEGWR